MPNETVHPYRPVASLQQVLDYRHDAPETHTASPIVNAVAHALHTTRLIECHELADYLAVDARKLAGAIELDMGQRLITVIQQYRLHEVKLYREAHPQDSLESVAQACGYASQGSLWRFFQRQLGRTPKGKKSHAGPERYNLMVRELRNRR